MPLETFVRNIYLDVTCLMDDSHHAAVILRNFCTIAPIFSNIRSLYIKMNWDERMVRRDLGTFLADTVSPSLSKLSIQFTGVNFGPLSSQPMAFVYHPGLEEWDLWFGAWRHLATVAFICEDFPFWETHNEGISAPVVALQTIQKWLEHSSLTRFEIWSGIDRVELSRDFQLTGARIHQLGWANSVCTAFGKESHSKDWEAGHRQPLQPAALAMQLDVCHEMCRICVALTTSTDANSIHTNLHSARWKQLLSPRQDFNFVPVCTLT